MYCYLPKAKEIKMREKTLFYALLSVILLTLLASCSTTGARAVLQQDIDRIRPPFGTADTALLGSIEERNRQIEDDPGWISTSYDELKIRRLNNISEKEYNRYRQFLDAEGTAYIIVHPAYYTFFHKGLQTKTPVPETDEKKNEKKNAVERFLSAKPQDLSFSVLQAQERRTRDFLEYKSTEGMLTILVLPRNYAEYGGYSFKGGPDEYTRYLNEVTNLSDSVLYLESKTANRGYLKESDMVRLMEFLLSIGVKKVLVGGGYVGRCLEDFYIDFTTAFGSEDVYVVPELSDVSLKELNKSLAKSLLMPDGTINKEVATKNLHTDAYGSQEVRPRLRNLP